MQSATRVRRTVTILRRIRNFFVVSLGLFAAWIVGRRLEGEWEQATDELRSQLGREPSEREVVERLSRAG